MLAAKKCSIKASKKELLATFEIYKEEEDDLKQAIVDCLGADSFNEEMHSKLLESLKGDEEKEQMEAIEEMVQQKEDIKPFIAGFIKVELCYVCRLDKSYVHCPCRKRKTNESPQKRKPKRKKLQRMKKMKMKRRRTDDRGLSYLINQIICRFRLS